MSKVFLSIFRLTRVQRKSVCFGMKVGMFRGESRYVFPGLLDVLFTLQRYEFFLKWPNFFAIIFAKFCIIFSSMEVLQFCGFADLT